MVGKLKVVLNKEKSDRVAEVPRVELSVAHDVVHRAVLDSTWIPHLRHNYMHVILKTLFLNCKPDDPKALLWSEYPTHHIGPQGRQDYLWRFMS